MRIKVEVSKLIAAMKAKHAAEQEAYTKEMAKYKEAAAAYDKKLADAVDTIAERLQSGSLSSARFLAGVRRGYDNDLTKLGIPLPPCKPSKPSSMYLDKINRLKLSKEPHMSIDMSEFKDFGL